MDYTEYSFDYSKQTDFYYALMSDIHVDSPNFARAMFVKDCERYRNLGARILINGDLFDGILPTDRKRYTRANDEFSEDAQINARVDYAVKVLSPYVDLIDFIGIGNHEASIVKYDHVDLVKMVVSELSRIRNQNLPPIQRGSYQGFLRFWFRDKGGATRQFVIYREHGKGGNSPVTKSTIPLNRLHTTYLADLYWLGHSHNALTESGSWSIGPDNSGNIVKRQKRSVVTAGYQDCFGQRNLSGDALYRSSFPEEKFLTPTGLGSALLHITVPRAHSSELEVEIIS